VVNVKSAAIAAILACALGLIGWRFWPGDERAIRKQLALIEQAGSKEPAEQPIQSLIKARQLAELFHDPCRLEVEAVDSAGEYSRKQIMDHIALIRASYAKARISLHDLVVDIPQKSIAVVRCTLRVQGEGSGQPVADVQELHADLRKIEGDWLFTGVRLIEVLER
jgi:hypothetical protein